MSTLRPGLTPKMKPLSARRSAILSVLDVGTTKVVCLIAKLEPMGASGTLRGRTHKIRIIGIGHQRSRGLKGGVVVDMVEAEKAIRQAVDSAERMAGVQVESVIINMTGGRIQSQGFTGQIVVPNREISESDIHRVIEAATAHTIANGRSVLHSLPIGYGLDQARGIRDPKGMIGSKLAVDMHVSTCDTAAARNLMLAVERGHLQVEAMVATPYASGLATLVDDEAEMGVAVVDFGGGTTSVGVFSGGHLVHADAIAVGSHHITMDLARGLTMRVNDAERLKAISGSAIESTADERELLSIQQVGEDNRDYPTQVTKAVLTRIIKPRVEEILELVRDRLAKSGHGAEAGRRIVLTGGGAQLTGLSDLARRIVSKQVRVARPVGVQGLPDSAKSPAFATTVGLLIYPQLAGIEHFEPSARSSIFGRASGGYVGRFGSWLKESF
ncbi:MAG: cell division protein FtsA [Beijerinckiaceae bacterium]|nr:cell division protein FtsA [Beijerinckiaceae bacterium]